MELHCCILETKVFWNLLTTTSIKKHHRYRHINIALFPSSLMAHRLIYNWHKSPSFYIFLAYETLIIIFFYCLKNIHYKLIFNINAILTYCFAKGLFQTNFLWLHHLRFLFVVFFCSSSLHRHRFL